MGSIRTSPLFPQTRFPNPKSPSLPLQLCRLRLSQNPSQSHIPNISASNPRKHNPSHPPFKNDFFKVLSEKALIFLVGLFISMGNFSSRPRLALAAETSSFREILEEKKNDFEEMYDKLLEKEPRNVDALKVALYNKMRERKTKEALQYVERLINIEPGEFEWKLLEAFCYEEIGETSEAKRLLMEILEKRPVWIKALQGLAMVMRKNNEDRAMFEMLNKALEVARREKRITEERNIRILIAQMHVSTGELEEGLKKFQDLEDEDPRDFRPYLFQGLIYGLLGNKDEAAKQFKEYQRIVPDEFPQKRFLDDLVMDAKTKSQEELREEFEAEFSCKK